jgi:hypothetical protein
LCLPRDGMQGEVTEQTFENAFKNDSNESSGGYP